MSSTAVRTFTCSIKDEYDGVYPGAFVAIRAFSESSQTTGHSKDCYANYAIDADLEAITYKVNYWYNETTRANGKRSRPLLHDEDSVFSDVFTVDIDDPKVVEILNGEMGTIEGILQAIETDLRQKNV